MLSRAVPLEGMFSSDDSNSFCVMCGHADVGDHAASCVSHSRSVIADAMNLLREARQEFDTRLLGRPAAASFNDWEERLDGLEERLKGGKGVSRRVPEEV